MDKDKEYIKKVIREQIQTRYNSALFCFSGLQIWARTYDGPDKRIIDGAVAYLLDKNSHHGRVFSVDDSEIENMVSFVILQELSEHSPSGR